MTWVFRVVFMLLVGCNPTYQDTGAGYPTTYWPVFKYNCQEIGGDPFPSNPPECRCPGGAKGQWIRVHEQGRCVVP